MKTNINIEECINDAKNVFGKGFGCSEAIIYALNKHFEFNLSDDAIAMSSSFLRGVGGSGCLCGAVAASSMCLGFLFGRREPHQKVDNCLRLSNEFHDSFKKEFKSTCCRVITKGMEQNSEERKKSCKDVVAFTTETTAKIIMRELNKN
ncbi:MULTISPECIES: C-GCAxxG-C-C family (seleno)protein [Brachyspira]|uniref:C-GCAxxG-C-C family (seleno)protein n=1 Tax=Brachyspira TaxID=29521 RepID=UPI00063D8FCF|nr:C-GCAxxG-C-C family (seleno)protein [Brachyspira hyodysenteriae]KLI50872.1 C_GCAxxG_C_C family protein [Brachyspira hyodysenteriae]